MTGRVSFGWHNPVTSTPEVVKTYEGALSMEIHSSGMFVLIEFDEDGVRLLSAVRIPAEVDFVEFSSPNHTVG